MTHSELNAIAVKWLLRARSAKGPGCHVAFQEVSDTSGAERCDAWGYSWGWRPASVLVEVKVSRSDFLADRKKPHRQAGGVGVYRYFMCPEGLINLDDLPYGWGLLWVNKRGHVKPMAGHIVCQLPPNYGNGVWLEHAWEFEADRVTELNMLAYMFRRVGDPDASLQKERELNRQIATQTKQLTELREEAKKNRHELYLALRSLETYRDHFGLIPANAGKSVALMRHKRNERIAESKS